MVIPLSSTATKAGHAASQVWGGVVMASKHFPSHAGHRVPPTCHPFPLPLTLHVDLPPPTSPSLTCCPPQTHPPTPFIHAHPTPHLSPFASTTGHAVCLHGHQGVQPVLLFYGGFDHGERSPAPRAAGPGQRGGPDAGVAGQGRGPCTGGWPVWWVGSAVWALFRGLVQRGWRDVGRCCVAAKRRHLLQGLRCVHTACNSTRCLMRRTNNLGHVRIRTHGPCMAQVSPYPHAPHTATPSSPCSPSRAGRLHVGAVPGHARVGGAVRAIWHCGPHCSDRLVPVWASQAQKLPVA